MGDQKKYTIYVIEQPYAPAKMLYAAAFHPLDEGESWPTGEGSTEHEAMADLVLNYDLPCSHEYGPISLGNGERCAHCGDTRDPNAI